MLNEPIRVIFVTGRSPDDFLVRSLDEIGVTVHTVNGCDGLAVYLNSQPEPHVVLTDEVVDGGTYETVIHALGRMGIAPSVVVCLEAPTPQRIHEVFNQGASDCLIPPYRNIEIHKVLDVAMTRTVMGI